MVHEYDPKNLINIRTWLQGDGMVHERKVYNVIRFLADVGGVLEIFVVVFGIFIYPISKFAFIYNATEKLLDEEQEERRRSMKSNRSFG